MKTDHLSEQEQVFDYRRRKYLEFKASRKQLFIRQSSRQAKTQKAKLIGRQKGRHGKSMSLRLLAHYFDHI